VIVVPANLFGLQAKFFSQIPDHLHPWIQLIYDPIGDGNCGFHFLANALGYNKDGWKRVWQEMIDKINKNKSTYSKLLSGIKEIQKILHNLDVMMDDSNPNASEITRKNWLNKLSHGQIVSNAYMRPIIFLSLMDSTTFLPLKLGPQDGHNPNYLLHVNENHWVLPEVKVEDGVTPISPPFLAPKSTSKSAKGWLSHIKKGQDIYAKGLEANKI
jgi:hypothetical protein